MIVRPIVAGVQGEGGRCADAESGGQCASAKMLVESGAAPDP